MTKAVAVVGDSQPKVKRKRLRGSCDACRKKKIKCDSAEMSENICTSCKLADIDCTHDLPRQLTKLERQQSEIQDLQERIVKLEAFIKKTNPDEDIERLIDSTSSEASPQSNIIPSSSSVFTSNLHPSPPGITADTNSSASPPPEGESDMYDEEDLAHVALAEHLAHLSIETIEDRFFGQSSAFMFLKHATAVKEIVTGEATALPDPRRYRRPIYWDMRPWELAYTTAPETAYVFPEKDLLDDLVTLYFERSNCVLPILHRPTFMKSLTMGQHLWDPSFGMIVLLVCAIGSKYSEDPRVKVPNDLSCLSAGWPYFCQIPIHRKSMLYRSNLYDLQYYALAPLYLIGTSIPHAGWNIIGIGLRYALEKGIHRRKTPGQRPTIQDELQKRAFWAIVCFDHAFSSFVGRPSGFPSEAYDVEYPVECDDEYWEHEDPEQAFKQPPEKPCSITSFINFIKLCEILGFALRTLYTNKKSRLLSGFTGTEWEGRMVAELDSSLNQWKDALPDFLQWDPKNPDPIFFHQSASLFATYYYIRIQIHRPFLTKKTELSFASIAMCRNASRGCAHVLETAALKGHPAIPICITAAFTAGVNIAITLWSYQRSDRTGDRERDEQDLQKCLNVLNIYEKRWHCAGRLRDMLTELSAIQEYVPPTHKRQRVSVEAELPPSKLSRTTGMADLENIQPQRNAPQTFEPDMFTNNTFTGNLDNSTSFPTNDWDLRKLFFTELNYIQGNLNSIPGIANMFSLPNEGGASYDAIPPSMPPSAQPLQASFNDTLSVPMMQMTGGGSFGPGGPEPVTSQQIDLANLWSDVPTAFGCYEDWDVYLSTMGQPNS